MCTGSSKELFHSRKRGSLCAVTERSGGCELVGGCDETRSALQVAAFGFVLMHHLVFTENSGEGKR